MASGINKKRKLKNKQIGENISSGITNFSSYNLSEEEQQLLLKGPSYIIPGQKSSKNFEEEVNKFTGKILNAHFFKNSTRPKPLLHTPSGFVAEAPNDPIIDLIVGELNKIKESNKLKVQQKGNKELVTLRKLTSNKNIIIKKSDKGGGLCIFDKDSYVKQALAHLDDEEVYQPQDVDHTQQVYNDITCFLYSLKMKNVLPNYVLKYVAPHNPPRTPIFYFNPKTHKDQTPPPPRPIISACDSPSANISKFLTKILTPLAANQSTYLKDSKHLLQILENLEPPRGNFFLVTADVKSLYTNIPNEEGIEAVLTSMEDNPKLLPPFAPKSKQIVKNFLHFVLKENYFKFQDQCYQQVSGTSMGTSCAPPYANIFMYQLEMRLLDGYQQFMFLYKRYIDDCFFIWHGSEVSLHNMFNRAAEFHPTIKFEFEYSRKSVNFLDLQIYVDKRGQIQTTVYRKPTTKNMVLHYGSDHSLQLKRNVVYGEFLRYKRNISTEHELRKEFSFLKKVFWNRGYPHKLVTQQANKANLIPRKSLLKDKVKTENKPRLIFRTPLEDTHTNKKKIRKLWEETKIKRNIHFTPLLNSNLQKLLIHTKTT
jgi:hypothetical protein